jgi:hypothetical protein
MTMTVGTAPIPPLGVTTGTPPAGGATGTLSRPSTTPTAAKRPGATYLDSETLQISVGASFADPGESTSAPLSFTYRTYNPAQNHECLVPTQ